MKCIIYSTTLLCEFIIIYNILYNILFLSFCTELSLINSRSFTFIQDQELIKK